MIKEKSCGAVVFKVSKDKIYYLVEYMTLGHISLPKGHVEGKESEKETVLREIKEETNLDIEIYEGFREKITYSPKDGVIKDVIFFLAKTKKEETLGDFHDNEVKMSMWKTYDEAVEILTFESDKNVLKKANKFIFDKKLVLN